MAAPHSSQITVIRGPAIPNKYFWSPFVSKLEARLRFAGLAYKAESGSPTNGPRGKIPYAKITQSGTDDSTTVTDSALIIKTLVERHVLPDLNATLSATQNALDWAIIDQFEEKLYFLGEYERWMQNYYPMRDFVLSFVPWPLIYLVGIVVYRGEKRTLYGQGTLRYSEEERVEKRKAMWEGAEALLKESSKKMVKGEVFWLWGGKEPTEADAVVFGFIASTLTCEASTASIPIIKSFPTVMEYATRIHDKYFPDYDKWP